MSKSTEPCAVCPAPGRLQCSRCKQIRFCSTEHQAILWSSHKLLCKPNEPLVFLQRPVRPDEIQQYATQGARQIITRGDFGGPDLSEEEHAARMIASTTLTFASPEVDPVHKSHIADTVLGCNLLFSDHAEHDAFSYAGHMLLFPKQSALGLLDTPTRQQAEVQVLSLATLLEKDAATNLIVLAVERLVAIIGDAGGLGRQQLFKNIKNAVFVAVVRRIPVDKKDLEPGKTLGGGKSVEAQEEAKKGYKALREILEEILGPD
ncbi:hypothetical protein RQP46_003828 [Phenoliferia psychrophenolica]